MRRFALALSLSLIIHAALLLLLPENRSEPVPREVMRVSLAGLPRDGAGGEGNGDELAASQNDTEAPQSTQTQPIEQTAAPESTSAPAPEPATYPIPEPTPALAPVPEPTPEPMPMLEPEPESTLKPEPVLVPKPATEPAPKTNETLSQNIPNQTVERGAPPSIHSGNAQQGNALEAASTFTPNLSGSGSNENVVIDASRLRVTKRIPAEYPMISRRRRDQGTVVLILDIRSGRVTKAEIEKSSGHSALDESAKKAVSAWEFNTSGFEEPLSVRISFVFSLTET